MGGASLAWVLRVWHGWPTSGTGVASLVGVVQAWHGCYEPGTSAARLARVLRGWHGPLAPLPGQLLPRWWCQPPLKTPVSSGRTHPQRGESAGEAFPYITRRHRRTGRAPAELPLPQFPLAGGSPPPLLQSCGWCHHRSVSASLTPRYCLAPSQGI